MTHTILPVSLMLLLAMLAGACTTTTARTTTPQDRSETRSPIALINGRAIAPSAISTSAFELAGAEALREFALDRALSDLCTQRGITISSGQIEGERDLLGQSLGFADDQPLPPEVLDDLRARRGLGPERFNRLLRRNAMLRALVGPVEPSEQQINIEKEKAYGTNYRIRLFVSDNAQIANEVRSGVDQAGIDARPWLFAERCAEHSLLPSADRGGLIPRFRLNAPEYPSAVSVAIRNTPPGSCSNVMSTESGYLVVLVEGIYPGREPSEAELRQLTDRLKQDLQRDQMQRFAQQVLREQEIIVTDRSLNWAWTNQH